MGEKNNKGLVLSFLVDGVKGEAYFDHILYYLQRLLRLNKGDHPV
jgi:hypothetical protein